MRNMFCSRVMSEWLYQYLQEKYKYTENELLVSLFKLIIGILLSIFIVQFNKYIPINVSSVFIFIFWIIFTGVFILWILYTVSQNNKFIDICDGFSTHIDYPDAGTYMVNFCENVDNYQDAVTYIKNLLICVHKTEGYTEKFEKMFSFFDDLGLTEISISEICEYQ